MPDYVLIAVMERASIRAQVLGPAGEESRVFEAPIASIKGSLKASAGALLEEMEREGFNKDFKRVLLGLPGHLASLRVLTLPFTDAAKAEEIMAFELGDSLVEDPDDLIFAALPLEGGRTLAVTMEKKIIENILESFEESGLSPEWLGLPLLHKDKILRGLHKDTSAAAFVDAASITVIKNNKARLYAYINDPIDLKFALATLESDGIIIEHFYLTDKSAGWLKETKHTGSHDAERIHKTGYDDGDTDLRALAAYAADGHGGKSRGTVNFRKGEFIDRRIYESAKRSFRVATALIILTALFWGANIYTRLQRPATEISKIETALFSAFDELFAGETAVDPLYQMEIKLQELRKEKKFVEGGMDVLEKLKGLNRAVPAALEMADKERIRLFELKMHGQRVVARGETGSFDHADRFRENLEASGEYKDISLTDVKSKVDGSVSFSIALTLEGEV